MAEAHRLARLTAACQTGLLHQPGLAAACADGSVRMPIAQHMLSADGRVRVAVGEAESVGVRPGLCMAVQPGHSLSAGAGQADSGPCTVWTRAAMAWDNAELMGRSCLRGSRCWSRVGLVPVHSAPSACQQL